MWQLSLGDLFICSIVLYKILLSCNFVLSFVFFQFDMEKFAVQQECTVSTVSAFNKFLETEDGIGNGIMVVLTFSGFIILG